MIRFILLIFVLTACGPDINYKSLDSEPDPKDISSLGSIEFLPQIEMMIIFLWPKDLGPEDEKEVIEIIKTSRDISLKKDLYLNDLFRLDELYNKNSCDCHLWEICEDDQISSASTAVVCEDINNKKDENDIILSDLIVKHDEIKNLLEKVNAINIDVGVDADIPDIGTFDYKSNIMYINQFIFKNHAQPLKIKVQTYKDKIVKANLNFKVGGENFSGDIGAISNKYNVIFSGEINTKSGYNGLIYWEHLKDLKE